jgi:hypothetical protein
LDEKEKAPVTVAELKDAGIDKVLSDLTNAIDTEDDANVGKVLEDLKEGLKKLDKEDDQGVTEGKPDPFADKVAKYAPQGK